MSSRIPACDRCYRRKERCRGVPCDRCQRDGIVCEKTRIFKKVGRPKVPVKGPRPRPYSRGGCTFCRHQKKKCDENLPACGRCLQRNQPCIYKVSVQGASLPISVSTKTTLAEESGEIARGESIGSKLPLETNLTGTATIMQYNTMNEPSTLPSNTTRGVNLVLLCQVNTPTIPTHEGEYIHYFMLEVSSLLIGSSANFDFLDTVIPLCLLDLRIRYPVLAIASSHRLNRSNTVNPELSRDMGRFRATAQFCISDHRSVLHDDWRSLLLSVSLVALQEMLEGNSLYWNHALARGAQIIHARGGLQRAMVLTPLAVQIFYFLDQLSSFSTCATPYIDQLRNQNIQNIRSESTQDLNFASSFGAAGDLYSIMGNISTLACLRRDRFKSLERNSTHLRV